MDPPWGEFKDSLKMSSVKRGASANYQTMTLEDIKSLPIAEAAASDGAILALWCPSSLLKDGLEVMSAYGFEFKQTFVWVKIKKHRFQSFTKWLYKSVLKQKQVCYDKFAYKRAINAVIDNVSNIDMNDELAFGMGHLGRNTHELVLIGTCGNIYSKIKNRSQRTVFFYENTKHSKKPELLQDKLELMFPNLNYLEVFGRRSRSNWVVIGNEAPDTLGQDVRVSLSNL